MAHPNLEPIQVLSLLLQDAEAKCDGELGLSHLLNASRDTFLRHHVRPDSYYSYYRFLLSMQNDPEPNWVRTPLTSLLTHYLLGTNVRSPHMTTRPIPYSTYRSGAN